MIETENLVTPIEIRVDEDTHVSASQGNSRNSALQSNGSNIAVYHPHDNLKRSFDEKCDLH